MDGYVAILILLGLLIILFSVNSIRKDIESGKNVLIESEKHLKDLSQLLNDAIETIEELDAFGEYVVDRIEQKVKWAKDELEKTGLKFQTEKNANLNHEKVSTPINQDDAKNIKKDEYFNQSNKKESEIFKVENEKNMSKEYIYKKAFDLYTSGYSLDEIAYKLQIGKGEAALALKIMRRKGS